MRNFIRRTAAALAVLCMAALLLGTPTEAEERTYSAGGEAVGYYAGWAAYQGFTPDQIPAEHLTQINYAFAQIDPDTLTIALENPAHDQKNLAALRKLRQQNQHLKLLISVGGWSDSQYFSDAVATAARRESFAASCVDFVVEQGARTTCQSCTRRSRCWVRGYATAMDGLYHLKPTLESKGRVEVEDLPGQLAGCIHPADLCTAANHGYRLWRSRRQTRARAVTLRAALTEQYSALAGALAQLAGKLGQAGLPDPRREARVAQLFAELGLDALECSVTADLAGRLTANVTICRTRFTPDEVAGLTDEMTRICRRDMDTPEITHCRTVTMLCFGEKPLFTVEFGAAAHAAGGQSVSGDALDQFCDTSGRAQMLLCDGMGTGRAAAVDGQMAAKLTAQLLRAGFAAESAARLVNVALGLKGAEQEAGATLDLLTVDLYTGRAGLFKAGAAPSFLVRGGVPRMLDGASLPMGVLDSLVGRSTTFALDAGDWVVLVSDGALTDGSDWLMQQLQLCAKLGHTPKQAAETVADAAARRAGAKQDDITVAVLAMGRA